VRLSAGRSLAVILAVVAAVTAGCGSLVPIPRTPAPLDPKAPLREEFNRNVAKWQASGITRYAFTWTPQCFCMPGPHLVVVDGNGLRVDGLPPLDPWSTPAGVPGLFALVRRAIDGEELAVGYDPVTGVPVSMDSDPAANTFDDELAFTVTDWTLDPPDDSMLGRITQARRAWDGRGVGRYVWSIEVTCDCAWNDRRFDITIGDGDPSVRSDGRRVSLETLEGLPLTIPDLFAFASAMAMTPDVDLTFEGGPDHPTRVGVRDHRPNAIRSETIRVVRFRAADA
jgi:Family of unknown function (DUF6174)